MEQKHIGLLVLVGLLLAPMGVFAQDVAVRHPDATAALSARWVWAEEEAAQRDYDDGYWVGYSIERLMGENSFMGSWSSREQRTTLNELIYGIKLEESFPLDRHRSSEPEREVLKEVALLFRIEPGRAGLTEVKMSNMSLHAPLKGRPLLWLGPAEDAPSLAHVQALYERATVRGAKEELVGALGVHDAPAQVVPLLTDILTGREHDDVRAKAAFWLGQQGDPASLATLVRTAQEDRSMDVREQAVFGLSRIELEAATDALIDLARHAEEREIRKKAIFWLGQKASKKAVEALGGFIEDDPDTEVQKNAVFALSQLPKEESVPLLINIARTHDKLAVRKQAIFWLGQSGDDQALEALVEMVKGQ